MMGVYQQPTDKFECPMCKKLQTKSCPICNKETNQSWKIALSMGKKKNNG